MIKSNQGRTPVLNYSLRYSLNQTKRLTKFKNIIMRLIKNTFNHFISFKNISFQKFLKVISWILLCSFLNLAVGCHYYKTKNVPAGTTEIKQFKEDNRYFILHHGNNAWHISDLVLNEDQKELTGILETLPENHQTYQKTNTRGATRYKIKEGNSKFNEVHLYTSEYAEGDNSRVTVPVSEIEKIEIYDKDIGTTVAAYTFSTLGIVAAAFVIFGIIVALTKSSCPFVYTSNGNSYQFAGEMYAGAIYSSLERDDFLPLPDFKPVNGEYLLKISNELLERQYTNLAKMMIIDHPKNSQVLIDKAGDIQTIVNPEPPIKANSAKNMNYLNQVLRTDNSSYLFNEENAVEMNLSSLALSFKYPGDAKTGKLILNVKNSFWLDYIYGKFYEQFGSYYNKFAEMQKKVPARKNIQWSLDQGIPLSVYLETENVWEFVDYFNVIGPLASRDLVMPVDLSGVKGDEIKIKLECGFMFWEIDYAAIDFSENLPVNVSHLSPSSAIDEKGNDVAAMLAESDDQYLNQPEVGNEAILKYAALNSKAEHQQSVFLHSRGYYEYIRDYKGKPDFIYLNSFKRKGAFTEFSKNRYNEIVESNYFFTNSSLKYNGN
ncbi:hypothetical protein BH23BAC1_BH23BAC1_31540 [soil metagenome]